MHLVCDPIESFTSKGIRTKDGKERDLDVVILATGFSLLSAARVLDTKGKGKQSMREMWDDCPRNYYGITYPGKQPEECEQLLVMNYSFIKASPTISSCWAPTLALDTTASSS